jgi:predicted LPLAT superfamily acyltransferase
MTSAVPKWTGKGKGTPLGYLSFILMVRFLGLLPAYCLLAVVTLRYLVTEKKARSAIRSLRMRLGLRTSLADIYRHFYRFGESLIDRFAFLLLDKPPFTYTSINGEAMVAAAAEGKGVIVLGAHVGNWEIAGNLLNQRIGAPVNVVVLDAEKESLQRVMKRALDERRMKIIAITPHTSDASIQIVNVLRQGEIVAMLGDRVLGETGERIDFLGAPALFPTGPFALAAVTGAPLITTAMVKTARHHYTFTAWEPIRLRDVPRERRSEAITQAMRRYVSIVEEMVRSHPLQWYNFYDIWG